jgi:hypothetical protein
MERQAQLERESYEQRAASDWNYYQQKAALDNSYDWNNYQQKAALDYSYDAALQKLKNQDTLKGKNVYSVENLGKNAKALYNLYNVRIDEAETTDDPFVRNMNYALVMEAIAHAVNEYQIQPTEAAALLEMWGLD